MVYDYFQALFQGDIDQHCATPCQFWYTPSCPPDAAGAYQSFFEVDELFDAAVLPDRSASCASETSVRPQAASAHVQGANVNQLKDALECLNPDGRKTWVDVGLAIHHDLGDAGLETWIDWAKQSSKFDLAEALGTWDSFKGKTPAKPITLRSVFYMAKEQGWSGKDEEAQVPSHIAAINENYFFAMQGGKALIFKEGTDPNTACPTIQHMKIEEVSGV